MTPRTLLSRTHLPLASAVLVLPLALLGCSSATTAVAPEPAPAPAWHVHGIFVDPVSTKILLATHDGLYDATAKNPVKVGTDTIDLMGFTPTADPEMFYASGHPGPGSKLPNPVGLIRSTDAGKTWEPVSRGGESDFHALTATDHGLLVFDGKLSTSVDGITWEPSSASFSPTVLARNPSTSVVLATTEQGLQRSTDSGKTWNPVPNSPVIQFAAMATSVERPPTAVVGVAPDGSVQVSTDAGLTWAAAGQLTDQVQSVTARQGTDGKLSIWAATTAGVQLSSDNGASFRPAVS